MNVVTASAAPTVDAIPFLRSGREDLAERASHALARDDEDGARAVLLTDQDDWWPFDRPTETDARRALEAPTLRGAMDALGYGPVGDYFAFRWSDPTFLSALGLLDEHLGPAHSLFELGCGIGHLLREAALRGVRPLGGDVVWSKLWLCRRFVCPTARLWCFDAADRFPLRDGAADAALCHDALHYLPDAEHAVAELRRVGGRVLLGHVHTPRETLSPGSPREPEAWAALLRGVAVRDDAAVARSVLDDDPTPAERAGALRRARAVSLAEPTTAAAPEDRPPFACPVPDASLVLNPLLDPQTWDVRWPSDRYALEYAADSPHLREAAELRDGARSTLARRRILLDLPEAW